MVEVDEHLDARLTCRCKKPVIEVGTLAIEVAVSIHQARPLQRGAARRKPQVMQGLEVLSIASAHVVSAIGADAIVEGTKIEV